MANGGRIGSLMLLNTAGGQALLAQAYRAVIENVENRMLSTQLKNRELSGDFNAGSVEAKRFVNALTANYGTAAANGLGNEIGVTPVNVPINIHKEIVEPLEKYDAATFGVEDLIARRTRNHDRAMARELERAFFACAQSAGTAFTTSETDIEAQLEDLIQTIETTQNNYVDGVPRDMIHIVCSPAFYGDLRTYLDKTYNANIDTARDDFYAFHGVRCYASTYLPAGVKCIAMVEGAIAQPVRSDVYQAREIPLTNRWSLELYFDYGTTAVMPDLIYVYEAASTLQTLNISSVKGAAANGTIITVNPAEAGTGNSYYYKLGTSSITLAYGTDVSSWTAFESGAEIAASTNTLVAVAEANTTTKTAIAGVTNVPIVKK